MTSVAIPGGSLGLLGYANISTVACVSRRQWQLQLRLIDMSVSSKINENDVACLINNSDNDKLPQNIDWYENEAK